MAYVEVGGRRVWHEVDGQGPPVALLHGAFAGADSWTVQVPALVEAGYRVLRPERRGHAHTPDVAGPLTYDLMAEDTAAYLDVVVGAPAHLVGWSDGAVVALLVAQRWPQLVKRLVLIGQYYNSSGKVEGGIVDQLLAAEDEAMGFLRQGYDRASPDGPEHFPTVYAKTMAMLRAEPEIDLNTLRDLDAHTLLVQGDRDDVRIDHTLGVAAALPHARVAVLPGTHVLPMESPAVLNPLLVSFLGDSH